MSDTPRSDKEEKIDRVMQSMTQPCFREVRNVPADFARKLEREVAEMTSQRDGLAGNLSRVNAERKKAERMLRGERSEVGRLRELLRECRDRWMRDAEDADLEQRIRAALEER